LGTTIPHYGKEPPIGKKQLFPIRKGRSVNEYPLTVDYTGRKGGNSPIQFPEIRLRSLGGEKEGKMKGRANASDATLFVSEGGGFQRGDTISIQNRQRKLPLRGRFSPKHLRKVLLRRGRGAVGGPLSCRFFFFEREDGEGTVESLFEAAWTRKKKKERSPIRQKGERGT